MRVGTASASLGVASAKQAAIHGDVFWDEASIHVENHRISYDRHDSLQILSHIGTCVRQILSPESPYMGGPVPPAHILFRRRLC
jgi:hypothetical protein